eukprot:TRINITY_DN47165_c0_g1_i1.p1 TRINITY_DN47165_c0_g1~~TRINITY_DN47165_c0_g1_i1.p1  ORF type:complete len:793 (+),score=146.01 TRINITY_DN47165_c0_g1_i1:195-2573(+)
MVLMTTAAVADADCQDHEPLEKWTLGQKLADTRDLALSIPGHAASGSPTSTDKGPAADAEEGRKGSKLRKEFKRSKSLPTMEEAGGFGRGLGKTMAGKKPLFTPASLTLDLIFFRRIFSRLTQRYGRDGEVPVETMKVTIQRLSTLLGKDQRLFQVRASRPIHDPKADYMSWFEFVTQWQHSDVGVNLTVAERIFFTFEDPLSSLLGQIITLAITALIAVSCILFIMGTLPRYRSARCSGCEPKQLEIFDILESLCVIVFTIEYLLRICTAPVSRTELLEIEKLMEDSVGTHELRRHPWWWRLLGFVMQPMNLVDSFVILPWYLDMLFMDNVGVANMTVLRVLRLTRLLRLVKFGRYFEVLLIIIRVFDRSLNALYVLFFYLALGVCFSSAAMYFVEGGVWDETAQDYLRTMEDGTQETSPFRSIPHAFWFCIVTYTTVGYGDVSPVTVPGKMVATCTMLVGIIVLAMPISVVSMNFGSVWKEFQDEERLTLKADEQDLQNVTHTLERLECRSNLLVEIFEVDDRGDSGDKVRERAGKLVGEAWLHRLPVDYHTEVSRNEVVSIVPPHNGTKIGGELSLSFIWRPAHMTTSPNGTALSWGTLRNTATTPPDINTGIHGQLEVTVHFGQRLTGIADGCRIYVVISVWPRPVNPGEIEQFGDANDSHAKLGFLSECFQTQAKPITDIMAPVWDESASFEYDWPADWRPHPKSGLPESPENGKQQMLGGQQELRDDVQGLRQVVESQERQIARLASQLGRATALLEKLAQQGQSEQVSLPGVPTPSDMLPLVQRQ